MNPGGGNITPRIPWKCLNPVKILLADLSFSSREEQLHPKDEQLEKKQLHPEDEQLEKEQLGLEMLSKKQLDEKIQIPQLSLPEVTFTFQEDPIVRSQLDDINIGWCKNFFF